MARIFLLLAINTQWLRKQSGTGILIIRLDHKVGDMVIFSDFLRKVRSQKPSTPITLIIHKSAAALYKRCPYADEILLFDWGSNLAISLLFRNLRGIWFVKKHGLYREWEMCICSRFDEDFHAPFISYFAGSKNRIAYSSRVTTRKRILMYGSDNLQTALLPAGRGKHEVERNANILFTAIGIPQRKIEYRLESWLENCDHEAARLALDKNNIGLDRKLIAIGFGAFEQKRVWPSESFAKFIRMVLAHYGNDSAHILLLGAPQERKLGDEIALVVNESCVTNLAGNTTILECAAILQRCIAFVGNDSGLLHLAASVHVRVLEISCHPHDGAVTDSNSPIRFGPVCDKKAIIQPKAAILLYERLAKNNMRYLITTIDVRSVFEEFIGLMKDSELR